jgi:zinc protease
MWIDNGAPFPVLDVLIYVDAGPAHDPIGLPGVATLVARMLRRGNRQMNVDSFERQLALLGAQVQTMADVYSTTIHMRCVARNAKLAMALVSDMLAYPLFDEEQLRLLIEEARCELLAARESVDYFADRVLRSEMFGEHPAGAAAYGTFTSLGQITTNDLREFHQRNYVVGNLAMAFAGQCTVAEAEAIVDVVTTKLPGTKQGTHQFAQFTHSTPKVVVVHQPDRQQVRMLLGASVDVSSTQKHASTMIMNNALGGMGASLLRQAVRENGQMSYMADSGITMERHGGLLVVSSEPSAETLQQCVMTVMDILDGIRTGNVDRSILEIAQTNHVNGHPFDVETAQDRISRTVTEHELGINGGFFDASMAWAIGAKPDTICELGSASFAGTSTPCLVLVGDVTRMNGLFDALDWKRVDIAQNDIDA